MMHPMLNIAIQAARNASKIILRFIEQLESIEINLKSRNNFVSEVDRLSEHEIIKFIRKAYPEHHIIAEESGEIPGNEFCWIIDPLDGTLNYLHGFPQYAISIALKRNNKIEIGVIYDPIRNEMFTATRGRGAQMNNHRIRVSKCNTLDQSLIGTGYPPNNIDYLPPFLNSLSKLIPKVAEIRHPGSAALNLAYLASGRLDGYYELGLKSWDLAAGILLIQEAGGITTDFSGQDNYLKTGEIVAGNSSIHKQLLEIVQCFKGE